MNSAEEKYVLEQVTEDLYASTPLITPVILAIVALFWTVLQSRYDMRFLTLWAVCLSVTAIFRAGLWFLRRQRKHLFNAHGWLHNYSFACAMIGVSWGMIFITVSDWTNLPVLASAWMLMFGVLSVASGAMWQHLPSFIFYTLPQVAIGGILMIVRGTSELVWLSAGLLVYYLVLVAFTRSTNRLYLGRLALTAENESLLQTVRDEAAVREQVIEERTRELRTSNLELAGEVERRTALEERSHGQVELLNSVLNSTSDLIYYKDYSGGGGAYLGCNQAFADFVGREIDQILGRSDEELFGEVIGGLHRSTDEDALDNGTQVNERWVSYPDARRVLLSTVKSTFNDHSGQVRGIVGVGRDITDQKKAEETLRLQQRSLQHMAHHDTLTGLPNRLYLIDKLNEAVLAEDGRCLALLFLDIDHFKDINDSLGHSIGDQVLRAFARRLTGNVRQADLIARLGGDEFTILLENLTEKDAAADVAGNILKAFRQPLQINDRELTVTPSIGISTFPDDGHTTEELLRNADAAMYRAKRSGRNTFQHYSADMTERALARMSMESDLHRALDQDEFFMVYQPQIDMRSGAVTGVEALIRWEHPEQGTIAPDRFIPIAEETGVILDIGRWVLTEVCAEQQRLASEGLKGIRFAINVSGRQMLDDGYFNLVRQHVAEGECNGNQLELEITESTLVSQPERSNAILSQMRELGIEIAVDDFGTGYSSLAYLKQYPITRLKIDASFVRDVAIDPNDRAIARTVIALGKSLELQVIAEGVETIEQRDILLEEGCPHCQGYYYSRPLLPAQLLDFWWSSTGEKTLAEERY